MSIRKVKSADRTIDLLELLANAQAPLSTNAIAQALDIPKSSLFHLLGTLDHRGYVTQPHPSRYALGPSVARLAQNALADAPLLALMQDIIADLVSRLNESCSFNVQKGDEVEVIATQSGRHALTYTMEIGDLAPLYAVSSGKVLLAHQDPTWLDAYLNRVQFERHTPNTIHSLDRLLRELERTRSEGLGFVEEEFTLGIVGLAIAIRDRGTIVGALNTAIPTARYTPELAVSAKHHLRLAATRAENLLSARA